jgi:DNA (cytosine-5)-methyltransferase 1
MSYNLTLRDLFAGAGGSSTGAISVPGVRVAHAMNHWKKAVDVHNANHPDADHTCADISQIDPRYFGPTDLLWASPECTNHSVAKGKKRQTAQADLFGDTLPSEAAERSRATMWDVPRFTEAHRYQSIIVENVVDARQWTGFRGWLVTMDDYGYDHQIVYLNSMHAQANGLPAPQSRDRMYVVFWRKGNRRPDLERMQRPKAYCPTCDQVVEAMQVWKNPDKPSGRYRQQYVYRCPSTTCRNQIVEPAWLPAAAAIDWSITGQRIGDRTKPLAEKTMARIRAGIERYWRPFTMEAAGNTFERRPGVRTWPIDDVLRTLHTTASKALLIPAEGRDGKQPQSAVMPLRTQTTRNETGVAFAPFIAELRGGGSVARPATHPMSTVTASGNHHGLVVPYYGTAARALPDSDALGTLTTRDRYGLVVPSGGTWNEDANSAGDPLRTMTTRDAYAIVTRHNSSRGDGAEMSTPVGEPLRTLTTMGHQSLTTGSVPNAEDCMFRMLEPHEVAAGMAFPADYVWEGNRRERVRMAGNAVTPPAARDLVAAVAEALTGEAAA